MKKTAKIIVFLVVALLAGCVIYWFLIHPNSYKFDTAVKNGDIVMGPAGKRNVDRLHVFITNIVEKRPDTVRITTYSKEGYPTIFDLVYDGQIIKCTEDNTRNLCGRVITTRYGEYTRIIKQDNRDYVLVDQTGKYEPKWIFQE